MIRIRIEKNIITTFDQTLLMKAIDPGLPERIYTLRMAKMFSRMKNTGRIMKNKVVKLFCFVVRSLIFEIKVVPGK